MALLRSEFDTGLFVSLIRWPTIQSPPGNSLSPSLSERQPNVHTRVHVTDLRVQNKCAAVIRQPKGIERRACCIYGHEQVLHARKWFAMVAA